MPQETCPPDWQSLLPIKNPSSVSPLPFPPSYTMSRLMRRGWKFEQTIKQKIDRAKKTTMLCIVYEVAETTNTLPSMTFSPVASVSMKLPRLLEQLPATAWANTLPFWSTRAMGSRD